MKLTRSDLLYHHRLLAEQRRVEALVGFWMQHLGQKYELMEGDVVQENGKVVRVASDSQHAQEALEP